MRRVVTVIAAASALALAMLSPRVHADVGPVQATRTRVVLKTETPGPSPTSPPPSETPDASSTPRPKPCPYLDTYCRKAFLPVTRLDPSPTPAPTSTDEPELVCRERLYDGSFEEKDTGWTVSKTKPLDYAGPRVGTDLWRAVHGDRMMYIEPTFSSDVGVSSRSIPGFPKGTVTRATLGFSWAVGTRDGYRFSDDLRAYVYEPKGEDAVAVWFKYNHEWKTTWTRESIDVTELVNRGWSNVRVNFSSHADAWLETWWDIDAVSLEVCALE